MRTFTLFLLALLMVAVLPAQNEKGMDFAHGSWAEIRAKAKKEKKYIFMDAYAEWCGPCKWMARNVFPDPEVGKFYNEHFVNVKFDMEKGEGPGLAREFLVRSYPTYLFFSPEGELVHRSGGAKPAKDFLKDGEAALDPAQQIVPMMQRYEDGERSPDFLYTYAFALSDAGMDPSEPAEAWLGGQEPEALVSEKGWEFISRMVYDPDAEAFMTVVKYQGEFEEVLADPSEVKAYITQVFQRDIFLVARSREEPKMEELKQKMGKMVPEMKETLGAFADYIFWFGDEEKGHQFAKIYLDKYCEDWGELNKVAWMYFEKEEDEERLADAVAWAERSVELDRNWYNTDTYANLLFKTGKLKKAKETAKEAIRIGKELGEDTSETEGLLKKIEARL